MFSAGSDLKKQSLDKILHQDFKTFNLGKVRVGVGQVNAMDRTLIINQKKLNSYVEEYIVKANYDIIYFLLTDILESSSEPKLAWG